jgi:hypothetical protein
MAFQIELLLAFFQGGALGDFYRDLPHRHIKIAPNDPQGISNSQYDEIG